MSNKRKSAVPADSSECSSPAPGVCRTRSATRVRTRSMFAARAGSSKGRSESSKNEEDACKSPRRASPKRPLLKKHQRTEARSLRDDDDDVRDPVQPGTSGVQRRPSVARALEPQIDNSGTDVQRDRQQSSTPQPRNIQQQHFNGPVMLINGYSEGVVVIRPQKKQAPTSSTVSLTLDCLQKGFAAYEKNKVNDKEINYLEAYCCKLPERNRMYYLYKRVIIKDNDTESPNGDDGDDGDDDVLQLIMRYVRSFAVLANFDIKHDLMTSQSAATDEPPNVLVVDKIWKFDAQERAYVPMYRLLKNDYYTQRVLGRLRNLYKFNSVKFTSTARTSLFANHTLLTAKGKSAPRTSSGTGSNASTSSSQTSDAASSKEAAAAADVSRPLKKRKDVLLAGTEENEEQPPCAKKKKKNVSFSFSTAPSSSSPPPSSSSSPSTPANPTLISFRPQATSIGEDELICLISIEVHLTDKINYN